MSVLHTCGCCCCVLEVPTVFCLLGWGLSFESTCWVEWPYSGRYEIIVNSAVAIKPNIALMLVFQAHKQLCKNWFLPWMGWGSEQTPWSTTDSGGDVKPIIDPGLRNQWLLYYIIIDGARKCHGQSTTYYLLCWIVSLVCVRPLCSALMFPYHVYLYCVQLAFIFLLWFHLGKWILVLFRGCKGNKFF